MGTQVEDFLLAPNRKIQDSVNGIESWRSYSEEGKKYSIIVLDNNSGIHENDIDSFNYEKLLNDFEKPLILRKVNYKEYPVFGFLFTENNSDNEKELIRILKSNLREYIKIN